jgi:EAL domain-containing protein (putative c-di-GMP-specific phosphodiesterase class I)
VSCKIAKANTLIRKETSGKTIGMKTGVCIFEEGMDTFTALDHAKSAAKWIENDINRMYCYYTAAQKQKFQKQQYVLENLDKALKNNWIKIYYQGIARVKTGKVSAFEALARWIDPQLGTLSPAEFIPVLKKFHLMHKLDLYIAEQACRDAVAWDSCGFVSVPITVNFSATDFDYVNVPVTLSSLYEKIIGKTDENPKRIIVEITEQDVARATDNFYKQIKQLRELGFHVWLDDFGSGYSSLSNFALIDVDLIKFDMDLLKNLDGNRGINKLIIQSMTEIARDVGVHTLSEGMETEFQKSFLKQAGCELAQGYLFHKPEPLDAIIERIKQQNCPKECETPDERHTLNEEWLQK